MQAKRYKINLITGLVLLTLGLYSQAKADQTPFRIIIEPIGTYSSAIFNQSGAEIVAHDAKTQRLFTVNALSGKVDVLDIRTPSLPTLLFSMDVFTWGGAANSVAAHNGLVT